MAIRAPDGANKGESTQFTMFKDSRCITCMTHVRSTWVEPGLFRALNDILTLPCVERQWKRATSLDKIFVVTKIKQLFRCTITFDNLWWEHFDHFEIDLKYVNLLVATSQLIWEELSILTSTSFVTSWFHLWKLNMKTDYGNWIWTWDSPIPLSISSGLGTRSLVTLSEQFYCYTFLPICI